MTDCYLCGHPILEGQQTGKYMSETGQVLTWAQGDTHFNIQDCLPTLSNPQAVIEGVTQAWKDRAGAELTEIAREQERERAAKIVLEEFAKAAENAAPVIPYNPWVNAAADAVEKIRGNDDN